jgi:hypothetical protein
LPADRPREAASGVVSDVAARQPGALGPHYHAHPKVRSVVSARVPRLAVLLEPRAQLPREPECDIQRIYAACAEERRLYLERCARVEATRPK